MSENSHGVPEVVVVSAHDVELEATTFRLAPEQEPMVFDCKIVWRSPDGRHVVGIERISVEQSLDAPENPGLSFGQFDYFVSGDVTIDAGTGVPRRAGTGDVIVSPPGATSEWEVHASMVKMFTMFSDTPIDEALLYGAPLPARSNDGGATDVH